MFHIFHGTLTSHNGISYIANDLFGIEVTYQWELPLVKEGHGWFATFFIYPHLDDNAKTIKYYAFPSSQAKALFEKLLKINGVWPKAAFALTQLGQEKLAHAVETFDIAVLQSIPGIWPKGAKKILVELKGSFSDKDMLKINADDKLVKDITKMLTTMGYDKSRILGALSSYTEPLAKDNIQTIVAWLVKKLAE